MSMRRLNLAGAQYVGQDNGAQGTDVRQGIAQEAFMTRRRGE